MKSKLIKFLCASFIVCALAGTVVTSVNAPDIPGPYGQGVPTTNQLIINI
jgi:hypothetical protein